MENVNNKSKAQVFIIGALIVSVSILSITLLLNTLIYTDNLSTKDETIDTSEIGSMSHVLEESTHEAMWGLETNPSGAEAHYRSTMDTLGSNFVNSTVVSDIYYIQENPGTHTVDEVWQLSSTNGNETVLVENAVLDNSDLYINVSESSSSFVIQSVDDLGLGVEGVSWSMEYNGSHLIFQGYSLSIDASGNLVTSLAGETIVSSDDVGNMGYMYVNLSNRSINGYNENVLLSYYRQGDKVRIDEGSNQVIYHLRIQDSNADIVGPCAVPCVEGGDYGIGVVDDVSYSYTFATSGYNVDRVMDTRLNPEEVIVGGIE